MSKKSKAEKVGLWLSIIVTVFSLLSMAKNDIWELLDLHVSHVEIDVIERWSPYYALHSTLQERDSQSPTNLTPPIIVLSNSGQRDAIIKDAELFLRLKQDQLPRPRVFKLVEAQPNDLVIRANQTIAYPINLHRKNTACDNLTFLSPHQNDGEIYVQIRIKNYQNSEAEQQKLSRALKPVQVFPLINTTCELTAS